MPNSLIVIYDEVTPEDTQMLQAIIAVFGFQPMTAQEREDHGYQDTMYGQEGPAFFRQQNIPGFGQVTVTDHPQQLEPTQYPSMRSTLIRDNNFIVCPATLVQTIREIMHDQQFHFPVPYTIISLDTLRNITPVMPPQVNYLAHCTPVPFYNRFANNDNTFFNDDNVYINIARNRLMGGDYRSLVNCFTTVNRNLSTTHSGLKKFPAQLWFLISCFLAYSDNTQNGSTRDSSNFSLFCQQHAFRTRYLSWAKRQ